MRVEQVKYMLMARDMKRAIDFYQASLGLKLNFESPDWSELCFGDAIVALHGGGSGELNKTGLSFQVDDIHGACDKLQAHGAKVSAAPENREGEPIWLAAFIDTEGNEVMLSQYKG